MKGSFSNFSNFSNFSICMFFFFVKFSLALWTVHREGPAGWWRSWVEELRENRHFRHIESGEQNGKH